ncbi:MAG: hypothetical protein GF311_16490 [Candidatus Lokiarchaeota archaeon]|nr:hypothetical protein [Candidatus Lokiarchaeota archaeon]
MTPPKYTKKVFNRLGTDKKKYMELEGALHYPVKKKYYEICAEEVENFYHQL